MKNKWVMASCVLAAALAHASGQSSGGSGGGGTSGGGTTGGGASSSGTSGQSTTTTTTTGGQQPNVQNPQQLPPGLQNRQQLPPGLQREGVIGTNRFTGAFTNQGNFSNRFGAFTNRGDFTNRFAGRTNHFGNTNMSATGGETNRVYSTNHFDHRHFDRMHFRDEATTPADQSLLIKIKQTIITEISVSGSGGTHWVPIHCSVRSGRVHLTGLCRNADDAQRIQSMVSQMPGVTGVENGLSTLPQDQAVTENDRVILAQIRQVVPLTPTTGAWMPLAFDVRQGVVGIAGIVPNAQESQSIETFVRRVPGVVQTSNTLIVDTTSSSTGTSTTTTSVPQ